MPSPFENAFAHAPIGMALVDMADHVLQVNDALCRITGHTRDQLNGASFRALSHPADVELDAPQLEGLIQGRLANYQVEKRFTHAWAHAVWVLSTVSLVRDEQGLASHLIYQVQDISERKELERRLEYQADHDFLTGLFNGRRFEQALVQETKIAARYGGGGAVLLMDLDHFKEVNDRFGHKAGDDLLKTVAATLRERVRESDFLARVGGDEFGVILPQADEPQAQIVADGIVKALQRQTAMLGDQAIAVTASVGVALFGDLTPGEILTCADLAMYEAKESGRNRVSAYTTPKDAPAPPRLSKLQRTERIRQAVADRRLELYCQPILDLALDKVCQYELLVRLRTEQGELLPPNCFLYIAERFGTVLAIDSWVVEQAVAMIADQAKAGRALTLNVNVSAKSIVDARLVEHIDRALADARVDPSRLVFELTETAAIGHLENAKNFTNQMRARGCKLALDDFGTGFGSFYYLKHFAFDYLKIDGDFIRDFATNPTDRLVVEAMVGIARGMGKKTVAEFVTDAAMAERLRESGVDYAQGYHIGVPQPVADMIARLNGGDAKCYHSTPLPEAVA